MAATLTAETGARFPPIKATNLEKQEIDLPGGLQGEVNLLLVAFQRAQQRDVDTWLKALPRIQLAHPRFAYYELPTIARMNALTRWFIDNGMRSGIPDKQQRARTITLFIDKAPFKKALGIESEDRIYALLVTTTGDVLWRSEGVYTEEKGASLDRFLATHHALLNAGDRSRLSW